MNTQKMIGVQVGGIILVALTALATPTQAFGVSNGSFETGSFTGWDTLSSGNQAVLDNTAICGSTTPCSGTPTNGTSAALLNTPGAANVSSLETFLGLTPGTLIASNVTGGSAISQTFTLDTAGTLSFTWNFLTNETARDTTPNNDFASYFLSSTETPLGNALSNSLVGSGTQLFDAETGFNSVSLSLLAGTYTLKFLVADNGDITGQSGLLVDNVSFQPIPEPATTSWLGGALALGVSARIRRRKSAN
jgi:MYXO-CTERM domain-containing protein